MNNLNADSRFMISDLLHDLMQVNVNLAGLPALVLPCGFNGGSAGLPVGFQMIGAAFDEVKRTFYFQFKVVACSSFISLLHLMWEFCLKLYSVFQKL